MWIFPRVWLLLVKRSISDIEVRTWSWQLHTGVVFFSHLCTTLDRKDAFSYLGLTVSYPGCESFNNYGQLWFESLHFRGWIWRFHIWGVNFFTTVNGSWLEFCGCILGSDVFTPLMRFFLNCDKLWVGSMLLWPKYIIMTQLEWFRIIECYKRNPKDAMKTTRNISKKISC